MSTINQVLFGCIEFLGYVIFLFVYASVIDPAWATVDDQLRDTWTKNNPQLRAEWDTNNAISDGVNTIQDTRTLMHKITNLLVVFGLPVGLIGNRIRYAVVNRQ